MRGLGPGCSSVFTIEKKPRTSDTANEASSIKDIRKGGIFGGPNSVLRRPFGIDAGDAPPPPPPLPSKDGDLEKQLKDILDVGKGTIISAIPVLFATNRLVNEIDQIKPGETLKVEAVTSDRSDVTVYGRAIVSIPKNHKIGRVERPEFIWYKLSKESESDEDHFRLKQMVNLSQEKFVKQLKTNPEKSALIFVHGYRVPFDEALYKSAQIAFDAGFKGSVVAFSWPSRGKLLEYDYDEKSAEFSAGALLDILKLVKLEAKISNVYIVAHSLGSRIVVDALHQAALSKTKLNISELIFAAPDVDKDVFRSKAARILTVSGKVTLYASSVDLALLASEVKAGNITRMGYVSEKGPTIIKGIETIDVTAVGKDMFSLNHSSFSSARAVLDDIGRIIMKREHPPNVRTPTLKFMPNEKNPIYWMYPF
jgi:esterase/lipase superfamily enzyme